jgi:hypothetical protein
VTGDTRDEIQRSATDAAALRSKHTRAHRATAAGVLADEDRKRAFARSLLPQPPSTNGGGS